YRHGAADGRRRIRAKRDDPRGLCLRRRRAKKYQRENYEVSCQFDAHGEAPGVQQVRSPQWDYARRIANPVSPSAEESVAKIWRRGATDGVAKCVRVVTSRQIARWCYW